MRAMRNNGWPEARWRSGCLIEIPNLNPDGGGGQRFSVATEPNTEGGVSAFINLLGARLVGGAADRQRCAVTGLADGDLLVVRVGTIGGKPETDGVSRQVGDQGGGGNLKTQG